MRLLTAALCATAALLSACSDTASPAAPSSKPATIKPVDAFTALTPPTSPGIGSFDAATARRGYAAVQGLLALSLAEPGSLNGSDVAGLLEQLAVPSPALSVAQHLDPPTRRGLDIRPLFARTVTLTKQPAEIVRSSYTAEQVRGGQGEAALRITWDGAVRYRVLIGTTASQVAYVLHVSYVFEPIADEPLGLRLVQVVPGISHAAPVVASCLDKGLILPSGGGPSSSDFGPGPWLPAKAGPSCPV